MKQKTESNLNIRFIPLIFLITSAKLSAVLCFCPPHPMILLLPSLPHYGGLYLQTIKSKSKSLLPYPTSCYVICYNSKIVTNTESQLLPSEFGKNNCNVLVVNCLRVFSKSAEKTFSRCTRKSLCQPDTRQLFQKLFQWGKCFQQIGLQMSLWVIFLINDLCKQAYFKGDGAIPGQVVLDGTGKHDEQTMRNKPINNISDDFCFFSYCQVLLFYMLLFFLTSTICLSFGVYCKPLCKNLGGCRSDHVKHFLSCHGVF